MTEEPPAVPFARPAVVTVGSAMTDIDRVPPGWRLREGAEIADGLHALKRLGGGRDYEAYVAWDDRMHYTVVAKVVRPHLAEDSRTLSALAAEAEMLARLRHPVIVRAFGGRLEGPRPHLVLEHIEGPRLSTLVRRDGPLAAEQLIPLGAQLASALHYLAQEGIVHLDVKPANTIMAGPPRLIDFSIARDLSRAAEMRSAAGTDTYMAPEQCDPRARGPVGAPADVFGLGATLYRAATGERPFPKGDPQASGADRWPQLVSPVPRPGRRLHAELTALIARCLDPEPGLRPHAAEVAERLNSMLAARPRPKLAQLRPRWR